MEELAFGLGVGMEELALGLGSPQGRQRWRWYGGLRRGLVLSSVGVEECGRLLRGRQYRCWLIVRTCVIGMEEQG